MEKVDPKTMKIPLLSTAALTVVLQEDFVPPPPVDETAAEKMERISATIKLSRNEITEIM